MGCEFANNRASIVMLFLYVQREWSQEIRRQIISVWRVQPVYQKNCVNKYIEFQHLAGSCVNQGDCGDLILFIFIEAKDDALYSIRGYAESLGINFTVSELSGVKVMTIGAGDG